MLLMVAMEGVRASTPIASSAASAAAGLLKLMTLMRKHDIAVAGTDAPPAPPRKRISKKSRVKDGRSNNAAERIRNDKGQFVGRIAPELEPSPSGGFASLHVDAPPVREPAPELEPPTTIC